MARGRIELVNELKTVITGDVLRIRRMRTDTYEVPNGLNLLCFTNHENAVPIEQGDRRWLTLFSPAKAREPAYYGRLFDLLKSDDFAAARSEEHTSELQSLMRNSYDVFCLK